MAIKNEDFIKRQTELMDKGLGKFLNQSDMEHLFKRQENEQKGEQMKNKRQEK